MSSEETPLMTADQVKEKITAVKNVAAGKLDEFVTEAKKGNTSIRGLALISGIALVISSLIDLLYSLLHFMPTAALISFYSLVMGSIAIAMEVDPEALPYGNQIRNWLIKYIGLVQLSTGRGVFYLIAGSLELTQDGTTPTIVGFFTVAVAIAYIVVGRRATSKVKKIREEKFPQHVLKQKFNDFDTDGDGLLDFKEFHQLLLSLEVDITFQGAEMLFVSLDRDMAGGLEFEEFEKFWSNDPLTMVPV